MRNRDVKRQWGFAAVMTVLGALFAASATGSLNPGVPFASEKDPGAIERSVDEDVAAPETTTTVTVPQETTTTGTTVPIFQTRGPSGSTDSEDPFVIAASTPPPNSPTIIVEQPEQAPTTTPTTEPPGLVEGVLDGVLDALP